MHANSRNRIPRQTPAAAPPAEDAGTARPLTCHLVEGLLCELWSAHFGQDVSPYDDFFELGGDSVAIVNTVAAARLRGLPLRSSAAMRNPTPARLAEYLTLPRDAAVPGGPRVLPLAPGGGAEAADRAAADVRVVPITAGDPAEPLFVVHSDSHVQAERDAVAGWVDGRAAFGLSAPVTPGVTVGELAGRLLGALHEHRPDGPLRLAGFGSGAAVAFELAVRLEALGRDVALLALVGPPAGAAPGGPAASLDELLDHRLALLSGRFALTGDESPEEVHARFRAAGWYEDAVRPGDLPRLQLAWARLALAVQEYDYTRYGGRAVLFLDGFAPHPAEQAWTGAVDRLSVHRLDHGLESPLAVIRDPQVAETMRKALPA
ncbi:thioesterase domain-containing protein [Kitasatospora sp. NPDC057223]|uniref:thioesterase domain-containing protein n=1 Tax=Kitasatospora sp. NPDC057223 TaxID=3346055 RepID=UPI00363669D5